MLCLSLHSVCVYAHVCFKEVYPSINLPVGFLNVNYLALGMPEKILFIILEWIVHVHKIERHFFSVAHFYLLQ